MTTKAVTVYDRAASLSEGNALKFSPAQFSLIKAQCAKDFTDDEFLFFAQFATSKGLNPLAKEIYAWKQQGKIIFVTSIDGFRKKAGESGRYNGRTAPEWMDEQGNWSSAWIGNKPPAACRVGVRLVGHPEPTYATVMWREFSRDTPTWKAMPAHMLAKVAESHALRAAFPDSLAGIYTEDEVPRTEAAPGEPKKVANVAAMLDEEEVVAAPDVPEQEERQDAESWQDWVKRMDALAQVAGFSGPDDWDNCLRASLKHAGFNFASEATADFRAKFEKSLRDSKLLPWWNKKRAAVAAP